MNTSDLKEWLANQRVDLQVYEGGKLFLLDSDKEVLDELDRLVEQAARPEAAPTWISVYERFPANHEVVLVPGGTAMYVDGAWFTGMEEPLFRRAIQWYVTHWMPLPAAPEPHSEGAKK